MKNLRLAFYGKGGIGKTTVSVNAALAMAAQGANVLLVGCDPKRDTTRLLCRRTLPTIVERYNALMSGEADIDEVCVKVRENLWCAEAGGPQPGVGCAGRGVLIALDLLQARGVLDRADVVLYDVLGDVVCGGFATPVTHGFTDRIFVVTSGEQASLLAANNIIAGMTSVNGNIGGLIYNSRGFAGEERLIDAYAGRIGLPVIARLPYSQSVKLNELARTAIFEADGAEPERQAVRELARAVLECRGNAAPAMLSQDALYDMIAEIGRSQGDAE